MRMKKKFITFFIMTITFFCMSGIELYAAAPAPMPLISQGRPAFASSGTASNGNDNNYSSTWRGTIPCWIAYDLSGVPSPDRAQILVAWYNNDTYDYDHTIKSQGAYNCLRSYTIQGNPAAGGGSSAPTSGWVTLVTVSGSVYHSRQHLVNFSGYNWLRLNITEAEGSSGNMDANINLDVHNAAQGAQDSWIFYGDSITAGGMVVNGSGSGTFAAMIKAKKSAYFPAAENGGIGSIMSTHGAQNIGKWLNIFPGRYVGVAYGTNDSWGNQTGAANFYTNMETIVKAIIAAGKIPVVARIPWSRLTDISNNAPSYNARIDALYTAYPAVVKGPDFWTFFQNNQSYISSDNVHPSTDGYNAMRQLWADTMAANVYNSGGATNPPTPAPTASGLPGDVNNSGSVDIVDALMTAQYYVGLNPAGFIQDRADVNRDGQISIIDALMIAQYYVGLIPGF